MKKDKKTTEFHTSPSQKGMGDYYGLAIKNPVGKLREWSDYEVNSDKKMGKPPKSLA